RPYACSVTLHVEADALVRPRERNFPLPRRTFVRSLLHTRSTQIRLEMTKLFLDGSLRCCGRRSGRHSSMNSFNDRAILKVGTKEYEIYRLDALDKQCISTKHLPYSLRILLENLLRTEDGQNVKKEDIRALAAWNKKSKLDKEIAF